MEVKFVELKQRHIEAFVDGMPDADKTKQAAYIGAAVRSAIKAGWIETPVLKADDVAEMKPRDVSGLFKQVMAQYAEAMAVDPE
jgi:hypothetical protein